MRQHQLLMSSVPLIVAISFSLPPLMANAYAPLARLFGFHDFAPENEPLRRTGANKLSSNSTVRTAASSGMS